MHEDSFHARLGRMAVLYVGRPDLFTHSHAPAEFQRICALAAVDEAAAVTALGASGLIQPTSAHGPAASPDRGR
jgi:hypothetical protein